jgi:hypothetical protein
MADGLLVSAPSLIGRRHVEESTAQHRPQSAPATSADPLLSAASWGAVAEQPAAPDSASTHSARAAAHAAARPQAKLAPAPAPASEPEPASVDADELLAAASWGAPAPQPKSKRREHKRAKTPDPAREDAPRGAIVDPLLMAASWGSAAPASKRRPKPPATDTTPPDLPPGADPYLIAAAWEASPEPGRATRTGGGGAHVLASIRRIIAPGVRPRLPLPSFRVARPRRLLPSRLRLTAVAQSRGRRVIHIAFLLVGVAIGLRWALPIADVSAHCPPRGEGQVMCTIQKAWLAALVQFAAPIVAAHVLAKLTLDTIPATIRRWRGGWRPARRVNTPPSERFADDPVLRAAAWGRTGEDEAAEQARTPDRELVEAVRAPRVVAVRSAPAAGERG